MADDRPAGRARGGVLCKWRIAAIILGVVAGLVLAMSADGGDPRPNRALSELSVWVDARHPGRPVPRRFLGLSFELSSARELAADAQRGDLVNLLRSLGPGMLRLGGASADTRVAWTDSRTPRPAWASDVLDASILRGLRRLAARSGWRVLLTVGLVHYDPRSAAREVAAAKSVLGWWLAGIEVGNEPDSYARHHLRPPSWTSGPYEAQVSAYRRAISGAARGIPLAGPGVSGSRAFGRWGPAEVRGQKPRLLTGHHYPLRCNAIPAPTIEDLLSAHTRALEVRSLARYLSVSGARATRFRMDETNTVSCGGRAGVSDTFASALWAVGYIGEAMAAGASGINLQGNPANCRGYSPVCASSPALLAAGALHAQPEWYALLLARALVGARPLRMRIVSPRRANVAVSAMLAHGGGLRVAIVDDEPNGAGATVVRLHVGAGFQAASVLALTAPSAAAVSGVELGGRAVSRDGTWHPPAAPRRMVVRGGVLTLSVPAGSAALVTVVAGSRPARR